MMRLILLLVSLLVCNSLADGNQKLITKEMTAELKRSVTWEVTNYDENVFKDWSVDDFLTYMGHTEPGIDRQYPTTSDPFAFIRALPEHFDSREKWGKWIHKIRRQAHCGSCWAHTSTEVLSDRFGIHRGLEANLSVQDPVSCDKSNEACKGGSLVGVFAYLATTGAVLEDCLPYVSGEKGYVPPCPTKCPSGHPWVKYHCKAGSVKKMESIEAMKQEIYDNGPIGTHFRLYADFNYYKSGIYYHKVGDYHCGHYMKVVGWGIADSVHYWIIANSFGPQWGQAGYVLFKMGDCGINEYMVTCMPAS